MKFFLKKGIMQKIIICIVLILVVNFVLTPYQVKAGIEDDVGFIICDALLKIR